MTLTDIMNPSSGMSTEATTRLYESYNMKSWRDQALSESKKSIEVEPACILDKALP